MIKLGISGGQTGSDRAFLDACIALGIPHSGYVTKNRRSEDGQVPERYKLIELETFDYPTRTEKNITSSDGTIVLTINGLTSGSKLTCQLCAKYNKPYIHISMDKNGENVAADKIRSFLLNHPEIKTLNGAGSRGSKTEGFQDLAYRVFLKALSPEEASK